MSRDAPKRKHDAIRRGWVLARRERGEGAGLRIRDALTIVEVLIVPLAVLGTWALASGRTWLGVLALSLGAIPILIWFWRRRVRAAADRSELLARLDASRSRRKRSPTGR